jgi:DNA repair/transcription protein MET18/MMS19
LTTSQVLIKILYSDDEGNEELMERENDIQGLAREACQECITILREPEKSQARPATKVLCALVDTTGERFRRS